MAERVDTFSTGGCSVSYRDLSPVRTQVTVSDGHRVFEHDGWVDAQAAWKHDPVITRVIDQSLAAWLQEKGVEPW